MSSKSRQGPAVRAEMQALQSRMKYVDNRDGGPLEAENQRNQHMLKTQLSASYLHKLDNTTMSYFFAKRLDLCLGESCTSKSI